MKKNLIYLTLLISVLIVSVVSAGITGYLVRGETIGEGGYEATLQRVVGETATVQVITPSGDAQIISVEEGETAQVGDAQISASEFTGGTLFRRSGANVEINVVKPTVAGASGVATGVAGSSVTITSATKEECFKNCRTFTKIYKLKEGQVISMDGKNVSIDFINAKQVKLDINGQITSLLNEGNIFELGNGQRAMVKNVVKLEVAGEIGWVEIDILSSYELEEGQVINMLGNQISIDFINAKQVMLDINGQITSLLDEGDIFELNGQFITVQDVHRLEVAGEIGWVVLDPSSCYFPYL